MTLMTAQEMVQDVFMDIGLTNNGRILIINRVNFYLSQC